MARLRDNPRIAALSDIFSLFAGKAGGIFVTLIFIPQYNHILGPDLFGSVAIILSLQAFFLTSDLGLATLISRDTAIARDDPHALTGVVWMRRRAETILGFCAVIVAIPAIALPLSGISTPWSVSDGANVAMIAALIVALVAINIILLSFNALGLYQSGAAISVAGSLARGSATILILREAPNLSVFLQIQLIMAALHLLAARWVLERRCKPLQWHEPLLHRTALKSLLRRCVPLTIYTLASAAAVNLDKSIVSAFISLETAGAYFLATTYALVPLAILSGPINSYFAPHIAHARHAGDTDQEYRLALMFQLILMCAVIGPSLSLGFQMSDWLRLWLHDGAQTAHIAKAVPILLAGGALSATGFYPTTYLIAAGDNVYLARLSFVCSVCVLVAATFFASRMDLTGVAWSYFAFYAAGFAGLWLRFGKMVGWRKLFLFLNKSYIVPAVVITAGYLTAFEQTKTFSTTTVTLLVPVIVATILGIAIAAAIFWRYSRNPQVRTKDSL